MALQLSDLESLQKLSGDSGETIQIIGEPQETDTVLDCHWTYRGRLMASTWPLEWTVEELLERVGEVMAMVDDECFSEAAKGVEL